MSPQLIYHYQQRWPFAPFDLYLADGRVLTVTNAEFIMQDDDGQSFSLFDPKGGVEHVDPTLVVSLHFPVQTR